MTAQELLDKKNASVSVVFQKFSLLTAQYNDEILYCFFEGDEDCSYYLSRIREYSNKPVEPIICNGKAIVIQICLRLKEQTFNKYTKLYFVDMDFDAKVNDHDIYTTEGYSIENYYCSESFFTNVLKVEMKINSNTTEYEKSVSEYHKFQEQYHASILPLNAWYYIFKNNIPGDKRLFQVTLRDKNADMFVEIDFNNGIKSKYTIDNINALFSKVPPITVDDIQVIIDMFKKCDLCKVLRGKYEIYFIKKWLRYLINDANINTNRKILSKKLDSILLMKNLFPNYHNMQIHQIH
jgi:hypothetical protein